MQVQRWDVWEITVNAKIATPAPSARDLSTTLPAF